MKMDCKIAFFCFILCAGNNFLLSEGMKFSHKKYVILITAGSAKGPIAKIQVETSSSRISYGIKGSRSLVDIDNHGKLKLMKKLDNKMAASINNTAITVIAKKQGTSEKASTTVIIIVLPKNFGDQFVSQIKMEAKSKEKNKKPKNTRITPRDLLRFLRKPSQTAKQMALSTLKLETKVMKIKQKIRKIFAALFGKDSVIKVYLHINALFSKKMIEEMEEESECNEPTNAEECVRYMKYRTFDGTCNNLYYHNAGASDRGFHRILKAKYFDEDGLNDPIGYPNQPNAPSVPSPHQVSRDFIKDEVAASPSMLTHAVMQFGQFIDHDLDLAVEVEFEGRNLCLEVPCNGSSADFTCPCYPILPNGNAGCIRVTRSAAVCQKHGHFKPREQINVNTAYIDASQIYGSTLRVANGLRERKPEDNGLLRSLQGFDGELLPLDQSKEAEEQLCRNLGGCFIAGDSRSNEQQSLAAFHSLFLREHNRIAKSLKKINSHWDGEKIYQETRKIMGAVMQKITYDDFLPLILGPNAIPQYKGYRSNVDPGVSNVFATGAFRFGHSLIRPEFDILDTGFNPIGDPIDLRFMFFNNTFIQRNGINALLLGLIGNFSERVDRILSPGITRHLFERENAPGSNLAALNIHRSRDHGIPGYNEFRKFCKLGNAETFKDTRKEIKNPQNRNILKQLYGDNPNLVEVWVAGLAETPVQGASVGPTFKCLIGEQFQRTRDGDRFFHELPGVLTQDMLAEIKKSSLSRMYCDNLNVVSIQPNAFKLPTGKNTRITCDRIPRMDLCKWKELCLYGKKFSRNGKCVCQCKRPWFGDSCENKLARASVAWHATLLNSAKKIVCSGALIGRKHVLTTASCARRASINGHVRLGYWKTITWHNEIRIKSIRKSKLHKNIVVVELARRIIRSRYVHPISTGFISSQRPTYVTAWGTRQSLQISRVILSAPKSCKNVFYLFNGFKDVCTLPAGLPVGPKKSGSPLVQVYGRRVCLVGLLTDVMNGFGKYIKIR
ncbi:lactoperoxidase-like [Dendronephthya gigantea]|uniref:lactoperoxidase-like n=1 Tax=Dendronephthya gigantea TaxID=151771 RepID=UPI00106CB8C3|nr:lactoperoxidase-like [Dendronephthya gigantea]